MSRFARRFRALWRRRQLDRDLEDELRFHLEMKAEATADPLEAQRRFGNRAAVQEACREMWTFANLESWWQDLRYALRTLSRNPGFTLVAVTALAMGIGADTAVFTIVKGAFSWNLGLDRIDRIVLVNTTDASHTGIGDSYPDFRDLRSQVKTLAGLAAYRFIPVNVSDKAGLPERYYCVQMSANGFQVIEQKPMLGRDFVPDDERPGAPPVVMLTHRVWQDRYGKDPSIVGKTLRLNETPVVVVGVMPPGRRFPEETDLWTPLVPDAKLEKRDNRGLMLFGRLADGAGLASVRAELDTIARRLEGQYPDTNKGLTAGVQPIAIITGAYVMRPVFAALWCAVGFVLLIACADVANMLLARASARSREISIRAAIGAGRARIVRQLLVESVVLSIAGGFLGWLVALGGLRWFDAGTGGQVKPIWLNLSLDTSVLVYLAAISIGTGILFGLAPALRLAKIDVNTALKDGGKGAVGGRRNLYLSNLLVVAEMALCVVLLAGAGLMIRSAMTLYNTPIGVNTSSLLTMRVNLPEAKYPRRDDQVSFHKSLKARLDALPGVEGAAVASNLPAGGWTTLSCEPEGATFEPGRSPQLGAIIASPDYFRLMRVQSLRGRVFTDADGVAGVPAVVVNESFAAKFWSGKEALGKRLRLVKERSAQPWLTVIGVVPDILQNFRRPLQRDPLIYLPYAEEPQRAVFIVSRTRVPPATLAEAFRREVQSLDENLPVYEVRTLEDRIDQNRLTVKLVGGMLSVFAVIALALASVGLYAVVAHSVSQRTQEFGVRMAMGASGRDILGLVFARGLRPLAIGMAVGLAASFAVSRILRTVLVGVSPFDPVTFSLIVLVLGLAGVLGCAIPARRAIRVDPVVALRCD